MIKNALSVDLESFVHRELNPEKRLKDDKKFIPTVTGYLLDLFDRYKTKTTFFVVGEIDEWYPGLISGIAKKGHEIGYHSHRHLILKNREALFEELSLSKNFLVKYKPIGFRAPRMVFHKEYLPILKAYGFRYDSSNYSLLPKRSFGSKIIEASVPLFGSGLSISILQKTTQAFIKYWNGQGKSVILCIHPWQFSIAGFKIPETGSILRRFIYQRKMGGTIEYLLSMNSFVPVREVLNL